MAAYGEMKKTIMGRNPTEVSRDVMDELELIHRMQDNLVFMDGIYYVRCYMTLVMKLSQLHLQLKLRIPFLM